MFRRILKRLLEFCNWLISVIVGFAAVYPLALWARSSETLSEGAMVLVYMAVLLLLIALWVAVFTLCHMLLEGWMEKRLPSIFRTDVRG